MLSRQLLTVILLAAAPVVHAANLCFFPKGRQSNDVPCDLSAKVSMCCGSVAACLSNGLCKDVGTTNDTGVAYARGTCTDPTWQSPICPQQCQLNPDTPRDSSVFDFRINGVQMWECDAEGYGKPAKYCCESDSEKTRCCATASAVFKLAAATPGNALAVQTFSPKPATTNTASSAATPAPAASLAPVGGASPTSAAVATMATGSANSSDGTLDRNNMIAVGVGAGVGGAAVASLIVMLLVRRMKRKPQLRDDLLSRDPSLHSGASSELDHSSAHRYWAAVEAEDGTGIYPRSIASDSEPMAAAPEYVRQAPFGPDSISFGPGGRLPPPPPQSAKLPPNNPFQDNQMLHEMP